jgi:hypothetical protein
MTILASFLKEKAFLNVYYGTVKAMSQLTRDYRAMFDALHLHLLIDTSQDANQEWFPCSVQARRTRIGLSEFQLRESAKRLIFLGILEEKRKGSPAIPHFKIDFDQFQKLLESAEEK